MNANQDMMSNSNTDSTSPEEVPPPQHQLVVYNNTSAPLASTSNNTNAQVAHHVSLLENLAPELRLEILSALPDFETLRSVILASPVLHAQFVYGRRRVLSSLLPGILEGILVDAIGFALSSVPGLGMARSNAMIEEFLAKYHTWQEDATTIPSMRSINLGALDKLVDFHFSTALPIAREFTEWTIRNMSDEASFPSPGLLSQAKGMALSQTECTRVLRAIYRYQIYQNLFGETGTVRHGSFGCKEIHDHFFALFTPWDIETMTSIDLFLRDLYSPIFRKVQAAV